MSVFEKLVAVGEFIRVRMLLALPIIIGIPSGLQLALGGKYAWYLRALGWCIAVPTSALTLLICIAAHRTHVESEETEI